MNLITPLLNYFLTRKSHMELGNRNQYHMYGLTEETILLQLDVRTSVTVFEQQLEMFVSP